MLERIPKIPPHILPVTDTRDRPLWSVMIPAYNCFKYLRQTLESVLLQDAGPHKMQIEVVDDGSTDGDVAALVAEVGKGRIQFYQQPHNVGSLRNFETCLNRAKGHYIHLLHGDDLVRDGFYKEIELLFKNYPESGAAFTAYTYVDTKGNITKPGATHLNEPGILKNFLYKVAQRQMLQTVAIVVKREVYEHLGSFFAVHYGEDWEMWARIAAHYPVAYSPKCLALYRGGEEHSTSISNSYMATGQNIKDIKTVINIMQPYLPVEKRKVLKKIALQNFSIHFAEAANKIYNYNNKVAFVQAHAALQMSANLKTIYCVSKLYATHGWQMIKNFKPFQSKNIHTPHHSNA